jgi:F-type H+-transporting ATPase subunit epsilon
MSVSGGFLEARPDHVRVLADAAEYVEDIDVERAQLALKRDQELLIKAKAAGQSGEDKKELISQLNASLTRASVRLKLAGKRIKR